MASVSILNELSQKENLNVTYDYRLIGGDINKPIFKCICKFGSYVCEADGPSKKCAKEQCANQILLQLKSKNNSCHKLSSLNGTTSFVPNENYVGLLNEYCSKNGLVYPDYLDKGRQGSEFIVECKHSNNVFRGLSSNKKQAKQMAAMLLWQK